MSTAVWVAGLCMIIGAAAYAALGPIAAIVADGFVLLPVGLWLDLTE